MLSLSTVAVLLTVTAAFALPVLLEDHDAASIRASRTRRQFFAPDGQGGIGGNRRNPMGGTPRQIAGRIQERHGNRLYDILVDGQIWTRHTNQIRPGSDTPSTTSRPLEEFAEVPLLPCAKPSDTQGETRTKQSATTSPPECTPSNKATAMASPTPRIKEATQRRASSRTHRAPARLVVNPKSKTYAERSSYGGGVGE
ncbi:hypothetical protein COOONC_09812 [Cooperia oncophora]